MKRTKRILLSLLATATLWTSGCDRTHVVDGGSDDTHSSLRIQGRVLTQDANALPNVVVRLRHLGLSDTTGSDGSFLLAQETGFESGRKDTLDYFREGEQISSVIVPSSVWTAPDVYVVQRDFSGSISGNISRIRIVTATLEFSDGTLRTLEFDWNPDQARYSGYSYFVSSRAIDTMSIQIQARDSANRICAQSLPLRFTSRSGSISIPGFDGSNYLPLLEMSLSWQIGPNDPIWIVEPQDTAYTPPSPLANLYTIDPGKMVTLSVKSEVTSNPILSGDWSMDGSRWIPAKFRKVLGTSLLRFDTLFQSPQPTRSHDTVTVRFRAILSDGMILEDSLLMELIFQPKPPILETSFEIVNQFQNDVVPGSMAQLHMDHLEQPFAQVTSRKIWIFGEGTLVQVSGKDTSISVPTKPGTYEIRLLVDYSDGTSQMASSGSFDVKSPAPKIESAKVHGDSLIISWSDSTGSRGATYLRYSWSPKYQWIHDDSIIVPTGKSNVSLPIPTGARSFSLQIWKPKNSMTSEEFPIPPTAHTFSGSIADTSKLASTWFGIGGFKAFAKGAVGQILMGEVARLDWWREDSTDYDGAALDIRVGAELIGPEEFNWYADTLSLDIATSDSANLQVEALAKCTGFPPSRPIDTLRWSIPRGIVGHIDLPVREGGWELTRMSALPGNPGEICWVDRIRITATQASGPRARQGFLEVDNVLWH